jgi:hypothetical protein
MTAAALLLSGCAWFSSNAESERAAARERLTSELGRDPIETLRAIGSAPSAERAAELASELQRGVARGANCTGAVVSRVPG